MILERTTVESSRVDFKGLDICCLSGWKSFVEFLNFKASRLLRKSLPLVE